MSATTIFTALVKGKTVKNITFWKKAQALIAASATILPIIGIFSPQLAAIVTEDNILKIIAAIGALQTYWTFATTDKIGL